MPEGIVRVDLNGTGTTFKNGTPVTLPKNFGNLVNWATPNPRHFGISIPVADATFHSNPVTWQTPDPKHFGNIRT